MGAACNGMSVLPLVASCHDDKMASRNLIEFMDRNLISEELQSSSMACQVLDNVMRMTPPLWATALRQSQSSVQCTFCLERRTMMAIEAAGCGG